MDLISRLDSQGIAIKSVLQGIGGNLLLYCQLCNKFLKDLSYSRIEDAIQRQSYQDLQLHLHTLKGVSANLGFLQLEYLCKVCLTDLQNSNYTKLSITFKALSFEYQKIRILILSFISPIIGEKRKDTDFPGFI